ncbi:MAG TPA: hypothetical protein VG734_15325 [Lacunisphaera sp.]|nr:hypothetical protein [Lacunisphaera sp.]
MMVRNLALRAFSLIEVIFAVGLFAAAVTVVLALLPALTRHGVEVQDSLAAQRLPDALRLELQRLAAAGGFNAVATQVPTMGNPAESGLVFVALRDASRLHSRDYLPPATGRIADQDQYFLVECWRFPNEPLSFDPQKHFLALAVRVSWPYHLPDGAAPTAESARAYIMFTESIRR